MAADPPLLSIRGLSVIAEASGAPEEILRQVDLTIRPGEIHALTGESGSGKSTLARAVLRLLPSRQLRAEGEILFQGQDLLRLPVSRLRKVRGSRIGLIPQEALAALNPYQRVGKQMEEMIRTHLPRTPLEARRMAEESLAEVGLEEPGELLSAFPHQLSLGMCQRVLIALALTTRPQLLLADEPTASLDAANARLIVDLLRDLNRRSGLAILFITHDCDLLFRIADRLTVLYAGVVMENGPAAQIESRPQHPYTQALMASRLLNRQMTGIPPSADGLDYPAEAGIPPAGCPFQPRCGEALPQCRQQHPELLEIAQQHRVRCHNRQPAEPGTIWETGNR
ncbi:MAG: ABC transporter ATP-binding protein [Acidobacteriota bacterium]